MIDTLYKNTVIRVDTMKSNLIQKTVSILAFAFAFVCLILLVSQVYAFTKPAQPEDPNRSPPPQDDFFRGLPKESPFMLTFFLIGFIINTLAGLMIHNSIHHAQKKEIKTSILNEMLLPDEKLILKILEENNNELVQSELVKKSMLGKLKVSRVLKRLETAKVIVKFKYGLTNKIKINPDK